MARKYEDRLMIQIRVAYATPEKQMEIPLVVEESCTVAIAIKRSRILNHFPDIHWPHAKVGIAGKRVSLDASLREGDRVEIYRSLKIDPKEARKLRAKRSQYSG